MNRTRSFFILLLAWILFLTGCSNPGATNPSTCSGNCTSTCTSYRQCKGIAQADSTNNPEPKTLRSEAEALDTMISDSSFTDVEFIEVNGQQELSDNATDSAPPFYSSIAFRLAILFALTILAGILIRYSFFRGLRGFFLLASVVILGFWQGGCPCMIKSFQDGLLFVMGEQGVSVLMLWFPGLLVLTYLLGKIWCGWLCPLGGLQEFLFFGKFDFLSGPKAQKYLRYFQVLMFVVLVVQVIATRSNIFIKYDPFKVAFNLFSANTTGYILLGILLIASLLVYRPFCRAFCPVGLALTWVQLIPGSRRVRIGSACTNCMKCTRTCKQHAIVSDGDGCHVTNSCIACGDCMDCCPKSGIATR